MEDDSNQSFVRRCAACGEPTLFFFASFEGWTQYRCRTCQTRFDVPEGKRVAGEVAACAVIACVGVAWTNWNAGEAHSVMAVDHDVVARGGRGQHVDYTARVGASLMIGVAVIVGALARAGWVVWSALRLRLNPVVVGPRR